MKVYWLSPVGERDDFGRLIGNVIYDARTRNGQWALMSMASFLAETSHALGVGCGQRYDRQDDGRWLKTAG